MDTCKHVSRIKPASDHSVLNPQKWMCNVCGTTESVWACLSCSNVACGRYNEEHAVNHFSETKHPLAIEVNEKYVFCYECDEYVLNDNAASDIKILRGALSAIRTHSFDSLETRGRARFLRSQSFHGFGASEEQRLRKEDLAFTVLKFRRYYLLGRVFKAWTSYTDAIKKSRLPREDEKSQSASSSIQSRSSSPQPSTSSAVVPLSSPKKRAIIPGVVGLRNLGNTCYMNSILQVLSHLQEFCRYFLELNILDAESSSTNDTSAGPSKRAPSQRLMRQTTIDCYKHLNSTLSPDKKRGGLNGGGSANSPAHKQLAKSLREKNTTSLAGELHALLRVLWSGKWALVSPHRLLNAVWTIIPFFKGYSQQDAQEFLCEFLGKVECELVQGGVNSGRSVSHPPIVHPGGDDIINRLFQGELISEVTCLVCKNKSRTKEPFMDLSLDFPAHCQTKSTATAGTCHVTDMLEKFVETEKLDGKIYACQHCNKRRRSTNSQSVYTQAEKRFCINKLPRVLRLHLKRFMWSGRNDRGKINAHVTFSETIDMGPYCHGSKNGEENTYQLVAVVMHHGRGFGSGHYTSYCWNPEAASWVHCNDARMNICSINDVTKSQAYILFYTKDKRIFDSKTAAATSGTDPFEEKADDDIIFNFRNSNIPRYQELKRKLSDDADNRRAQLKRRRTVVW